MKTITVQTAERLATIEADVKYIRSELKDIRGALLGTDNKRGLVEQFAEIRGGVRMAKTLGGGGAITAILTTLLQYFRIF